MTVADRRLEIISILGVSGHTTSRELAQEFGVTRRTILHDVSVLSYGYPVYTKPGEGGGIFIMDSYKPYNNTLTPVEQERLKKMYDAAEGEGNKILERVLRKYGAYKLDMSQAASLGTTTRSMYKPDSQEGRVVRPKAVIEKWPRYVIM